MSRTIRMSLLPLLAAATGIAVAQPAPGQPGPGMMGGWGEGYHMGPGMMDGWAPGQRMGPGMMGGWSQRHGMGPGMMGGWGHGYGMGPDMMGFGAGRALWMLDLDEKQRGELLKIQDEARKRHWEIAGKMHDEMARMRDAMRTEGKRDRDAALAAFDRMSALRKQRLEIALDTADRMDQILTPEQREKLRRWGPWQTPGGPGRQ